MSSADPKVVYPARLVQTDPVTGKKYIDCLVRQPDGTVKARRRYGELWDCIECGFKFLKLRKTADGYCSRSCARKGKPAPRKKQSRTAMKEKCDRLFSIAVRERGACERCGASSYADLQCAHIVSRRYLATRWDWDNAFCLCKGCHYWGHGNPLAWDLFVESKIGADGYSDIKRRALAGTATVNYDMLVERMEVLVEMHSGVERPEAFIEYTYRQRTRLKEERDESLRVTIEGAT